MEFIKLIRSKFRRWERQKAIKILTTTDPEKIVKHGEELLIKAFHRAARRVPAYKKLLQEKRVDPDLVKDIETFRQHVPVIIKEEIFPESAIEDLCLDRQFYRIKSAMSSSGFSGVFAFGINTPENHINAVKSIDTALDFTFDISRRKTFFINALPMGVKIPTDLPVADTSVRADMALAIYKKFSHAFDQIIILSDPHFLKKLLEDGMEQGIDWKKESVHLITGEDWVPETFRSYLGHILGTDWNNPERGFVGGTMGVAELDLNLFHESQDSILIQRAAHEDKNLRYALYGEGVDICPTLLHYYPHRTYLELLDNQDGQPELVVTMLSPSLLIPLIRYNIKDIGMILSYRDLISILEKCGYSHLCPRLKLPLVAVGGRKGRFVSKGDSSLYPEEVKQGIYSDFSIASKTTGYFRIEVERDTFLVEIQLKKGIDDTPDLQAAFSKAISTYVKPEFKVRLFPYSTFPYAMELDYESKFKNVT